MIEFNLKKQKDNIKNKTINYKNKELIKNKSFMNIVRKVFQKNPNYFY